MNIGIRTDRFGHLLLIAAVFLSAGNVMSEENDDTANKVAPVVQASELAVERITSNTVDLKWKRGSGTASILFMSEKDSLYTIKLDSAVTYSADTIFGRGDTVANEWYCIYNGNDSTVKISGLKPSSSYQLAVFEYNGSSGKENYLTIHNEKNSIKVVTSTPERVAQHITFDSIPPLFAGDTSIPLKVTSSSGLDLKFKVSDTTVLQLKNGCLKTLKAGTTLIVASQEGNEKFEPAKDVTIILTVTEKTANNPKNAENVKKNEKKFRKHLVIAGAIAGGTAITAIIISAIISNDSDNSDDHKENVVSDRPPSDPF